jgi:hypothetical protein
MSGYYVNNPDQLLRTNAPLIQHAPAENLGNKDSGEAT